MPDPVLTFPPRLAVPVMFRLAKSAALLPSTVLLSTVRLFPLPSTAPVTLTVSVDAFSVTSLVNASVEP